MSLATREQKGVMTDFAGDGTFWFFSVMKRTLERHEENTSERLRLEAAIEYNGERKRGYPTAFTTLSVLLATNLGSRTIPTKLCLSARSLN